MNIDLTIFEGIYNYLGIELYARDTAIFVTSFGVAMGISLLIRVLTGLAYYANISALMLFAKPVDKKDDVKKTPSQLINRSVSEYMFCGESGAPLLNIEAIVNKNILKMSFLGANFISLERLSRFLEAAAAVIAALAVLSGGAGFAAVFGVVFLVYKIIAVFFDGEMFRNKLLFGISTYINRELGKFFIADDKSGLRIFKTEIHTALMEQASILQNAINNLNTELSRTVKDSCQKIEKSAEGERKKFDDIAEKLAKPVERLTFIYDKLNVAAEFLNENIKAQANATELLQELKPLLKAVSEVHEALGTELSTIKTMQKALETSLTQYELSLQQTAGAVGDAVGSIIEYRGKQAADSLNETMLGYTSGFQSDAAKLIEKMSAFFEQAYEQNRSEIQTLLRIEETVNSVKDGK